jgi:hypothetical protein
MFAVRFGRPLRAADHRLVALYLLVPDPQRVELALDPEAPD